MNDNALGTLLKEARIAKKLTQLDVAQRLDTEKSFISHWERGVRLPPDSQAPDAMFLTRLLGIPLEEYHRLRSRADVERRLDKIDGMPLQIALREYLIQVGGQMSDADMVADINESLIIYTRHMFSPEDSDDAERNKEARAQAIASVLSLGLLLADANQIDGLKAVVEQYLYRIDQLHQHQAGKV
jgi:transcriptional regulator with XRE-family HTH domain